MERMQIGLVQSSVCPSGSGRTTPSMVGIGVSRHRYPDWKGSTWRQTHPRRNPQCQTGRGWSKRGPVMWPGQVERGVPPHILASVLCLIAVYVGHCWVGCQLRRHGDAQGGGGPNLRRRGNLVAARRMW